MAPLQTAIASKNIISIYDNSADYNEQMSKQGNDTHFSWRNKMLMDIRILIICMIENYTVPDKEVIEKIGMQNVHNHLDLAHLRRTGHVT